MTIEEFFNRSADYYDDWLRQAIPYYDQVFATAVELIPFDPNDEIRVLDLGAGTGLFAWHVMQRFTHKPASFSTTSRQQMLDVARERFGESKDRVSIVETDYLRLDAIDTYDAIVSSFSIHHLAHVDKQRLFSLASSRPQALRRIHQYRPDTGPNTGPQGPVLVRLAGESQIGRRR